MSKSLLLIPLVVLITGCNDIYSAIDYKYPKDKHGFWSECVRNEYLKYKTSSPTLEKAIDAKCKREMMIKEIRRHRKKQKEMEETVQEAIEYNKESKKKTSTQSQTSTHNGLTATHNGKNYRQMIPGDDDSWEEY